MIIKGTRLQGLFGEVRPQFEELPPHQPFKKDLEALTVDVDTLRGFLLLGGVEERTQDLLNDIHGPVEAPNKELLLTFNQTQSYWKKSPTYFNGPKENFIIAINLAYHYRGIISYYDRKSKVFEERSQKAGLNCSTVSGETAKLKTIERYFKATYDGLYEDPQFETTLKLYKGIKNFDEARECRSYNKEKSDQLLKVAKTYFKDLLKGGKELSTAITFLGIIEALMGRVESALRFLVRAADMVFNPRPLYKLMGKLFKILRMRNASSFYKRKSVTGNQRLCLVS